MLGVVLALPAFVVIGPGYGLILVGVSAASASLEASEPVATRVPSSATAPVAVPVITGASSSPATVTVTLCVTLSPSAVVAVTVNVSLTVWPPARLCAAALSRV